MKIKDLLLICLIMPIIIQAQTQEKELKIEYDYFSEVQKSLHREKKIELRVTQNYAVSKYIAKTYFATAKITSSGMEKGEPEEVEVNNYVFKDYNENHLAYFENIRGDICVREPLQQFKWTITNNTDTILGYVCRQAKTLYRGRDYIAYFTTDMPFKAAPWKFHGLPGVMLKVYSVDGFVKAEAISLKIQPVSEPKINHFKNEKPITYIEFSELYVKNRTKIMERMKAMAARLGRPVAIGSEPRIEVIVEDDYLTEEENAKRAMEIFQNR